MKKLTLFGKVVVAIFFIIVVAILYSIFMKPEETGPDYSVPAQLTFQTKNLPLMGSSAKKFRASTSKVTNYCSFFSNYGQNRGIPISFNAYIPSNYRESLYYYQNPRTGEQYIPAYFIAPGGNGLDLAVQYSQEEYDRLPACVNPPDLDGTGGLILIGFPKGRIPTGNFAKVYGALWWDSINLNPGQVSTEAGAETASAPVVKVADYENLTNSQALDPANQTFLINTVVQTGKGIIRVKRIEFGDKQTRVLVQVFNASSRTIAPWLGASEACIRPRGEVCSPITDAIPESAASTDAEGEEGASSSDILPADNPIPPASTGASLKGYLVFDRFDPDQPLQLELPDFSINEEAGQTSPIILDLPNEKNSRAVDEDSKSNGLH